MPYPKKDPSTLRQFRIIKMLYRMKPLQSIVLAEKLNVSTRTILRDMRRIEKVIPLMHSHGSWSLGSEALVKLNSPLTHTLLGAFAHNMDIDLVCFDKSTLTEDRIDFAIEYRHLPKVLGEKIVDALQKERRCTFIYNKPKGSSVRKIDPVKLYTENGRWYLVARDYKDDKIKTFNLSKIKNLQMTNIPISLTDNMRKEADNIQSIWSSSMQNAQKVVLYIKPDISDYIQDIKLHKTQEIADRHYDGGLEVHCMITHKLEILPAIKSWLPYVHVLEPKWLWEELMRDLEHYKNEDWKMDI